MNENTIFKSCFKGGLSVSIEEKVGENGNDWVESSKV